MHFSSLGWELVDIPITDISCKAIQTGEREEKRMIEKQKDEDWLILIACQPAWGYFMTRV